MPPGIGYGPQQIPQRQPSDVERLQQGPNNLLAMLQQLSQQPPLPQQDRPGGPLGALIQLLQRGNRQPFQGGTAVRPQQPQGGGIIQSLLGLLRQQPPPQPPVDREQLLGDARTLGRGRQIAELYAQQPDSTRRR